MFPVATVPLTDGSLYLFTDGVTESVDEQNRTLDMSGLTRLIQDCSQVAGSRRLHNIVAEIRKPRVSQRDDITLMLIECKPN
ncbi:Stage II sporulation protein E (SpoIIE) [compost metagenome]